MTSSNPKPSILIHLKAIASMKDLLNAHLTTTVQELTEEIEIDPNVDIPAPLFKRVKALVGRLHQVSNEDTGSRGPKYAENRDKFKEALLDLWQLAKPDDGVITIQS